MEPKSAASLDLRQLVYFVAIAESGSVSRAAAQLSIAQPSLSESLARFEKQLGTKLVIRSPRGIELTEAGTTLARHGRKIVKDLESALEEVRALDTDVHGMVSIALTPSLARLLMVSLAESLHVEHPQLRLQLCEGNSGHVSEWVRTEQVDLGVTFEGLDLTPFSARHLFSEELFVISAPDNWPPPNAKSLGGGLAIDFAALKDVPLILPTRMHGQRALVEREAKAAGFQLNVELEIDPLPHLVSMVERASGHTILSHAAVEREVADGRLVLVKICNPTIRRGAYLVRKFGRPIARSTQIVENMVVSLVSEIASRSDLGLRVVADARAPSLQTESI
jgi:LysR family nitrogen assimilation transcriptional regulator